MHVKPGEARPVNFPSLSITPISALGTHWKQKAMLFLRGESARERGRVMGREGRMGGGRGVTGLDCYRITVHFCR